MEMKVTYCMGTVEYPSLKSAIAMADCHDWKNVMIHAMKHRKIKGPEYELRQIIMCMSFVAIKAYLTETYQMLLESVPPEGHPGAKATFGTQMIGIRVEW